MTLAINLRKMVHRKSAEYCAPVGAGNTVAGSFFVSDKADSIPGHDCVFYVGSASAIWNYNADQDAWIQLPNSGITGTFGAGACGDFRAISAPGGAITNTATAGTTTTITTALNMTRSLLDCEIRVVGGTGMGYSGKIKSLRIGANSVITVVPASAVAFDNTTQFQYFGGSLWFFNSGAGAVGFSVYDRSTNAWTARAVAGIPTTWGTEGKLMSTSGKTSNRGAGFVNSTASSGTGTTLTDSTQTWPVNGWSNFQVRIISGTGAGQIRAITSNTANTLTNAAWTVTPDATSVYRIEGDDNAFYLLGNNAVVMYKYSISANTWATVTPTVARTVALAGGGTASWIDGIQSTDWSDGTYSTHNANGGLIRQNGRYIYSFNGGATNTLSVFDIATLAWTAVPYGNQTETFTAGSSAVDLDGYVYYQKDATGRIFRFDVLKNTMEPWVFNPIPQGAAIAGDKLVMTTYVEDSSRLNYLYALSNSRSELTRWLVI